MGILKQSFEGYFMFMAQDSINYENRTIGYKTA